MNPTEYEVRLIGWLRDASDEQRERFGLDLITRQYQEIQSELEKLLPRKQGELLQELLMNLRGGTIESLANLASELYLVFHADEALAEELDLLGFTELLSMIACWLSYRELRAPDRLTDAAMNRMNILDRAEDVDGDWSSTRMLTEIDYQHQLLMS